MTNARRDGLYFLVPGIVVFLLFGFALRHSAGWMGDFKVVYYGARCLLEHHDPYDEGELYRAEIEGMKTGEHLPLARLSINLPTTLFLTVPFAMMPVGSACALWMTLIALSLTLGAILTWRLGANYAPLVCGGMIGFVLANGAIVLGNGNEGGMVVGLCVISVWCFLTERCVLAGILFLAISVAIKPHDAGLVWLYFLLAGGIHRKRAIQTLVVTVALSLPAALWMWQVSPNWIQEMHSNIMAYSVPGGFNDPGPAGWNARHNDTNVIINLQTVVSVFRDDPQFYNHVTYLICGVPLLLWAIVTVRSRPSRRRTWFALASAVPITMLITYHHAYDAKLLLLAIPACAILWAEGGPLSWAALVVNTAGIVCTGEISIAYFNLLTQNLHVSASGFEGKLLTILLFRPASLALLVMAVFNLWVYVRRAAGESADAPPEESTLRPATSTVA